jgi:hypothetical protein
VTWSTSTCREASSSLDDSALCGRGGERRERGIVICLCWELRREERGVVIWLVVVYTQREVSMYELPPWREVLAETRGARVILG